MTAPNSPVVSILIPALNEAENIGRCLASIAEYFPCEIPAEVIVGDHGSTDGTPRIVIASGHRVVEHCGGTVGGLRNRLVAEASGDVLIFLDADTAVTVEWASVVASAVERIRTSPFQVTGSFCLPPPSDSPFIRHWFALLPRIQANYLGTGHLLTSRVLFDQLGGFDSELRSGEDYDFCQRACRLAGAQILPRPEMLVYHYDYPLDALSFLKREIWHGTGDFQSWQAFSSSRVAKTAAVFVGLQFSAIAAGCATPMLGAVLQCGVLALVSAASMIRFPGLDARSRSINIAIFYLYLAARAASIVNARR